MNSRSDILQPVSRISCSCGWHAAILSVLLDLHLLQNRVPRDLMLFGDCLHQRLNKVLGRLNTKDSQHRPFGLNPQRLLIRVGVSDVGKPVGKFKSDWMISSISKFVVTNGRHTVQLAENRSKGIVTFGGLDLLAKGESHFVYEYSPNNQDVLKVPCGSNRPRLAISQLAWVEQSHP